MKYTVMLEQSEEGFAVSVPGLPGCHSQGETEEEALLNIVDAIREYQAAVPELLRIQRTSWLKSRFSYAQAGGRKVPGGDVGPWRKSGIGSYAKANTSS